MNRIKQTQSYFQFLLLGLLIVWAGFSFFWGLGRFSLQPWDEAWYGVISRELIQSKNPILLTYNHQPYFDHPQLSFYLKAISMLAFGETAFAVRFPEAIAALITLGVAIAIGKKVGSHWISVWAVAAIFTGRWFLFRARTGNIDLALTLSQLFMFWLVLHLRKAKKQLLPHFFVGVTWFFFALSLSTKSLISWQLLPLIVLAMAEYIYHNSFFKKPRTLVTIVGIALVSFMIGLLPQILLLTSSYRAAFIERQILVGFRGGTEKHFSIEYTKLTITYLRAALNKWFWVNLLGTGLLAVTALLSKKFRAIAIYGIGFVSLIGAPYFISEKTEIWHLIPLGVALSLTAALGFYAAIEYFFEHVSTKIKLKPPQQYGAQFGVYLLVTGCFMLVAGLNWKNYVSEFLFVEFFPEDYQKIARSISYPDQTLYVSTDSFYPGLTYYADLQPPNRVVILSNDRLPDACSWHAHNQKTLQAVGWFGGWLNSQVGDEFIRHREGALILVELTPEDCYTLFPELKELPQTELDPLTF